MYNIEEPIEVLYKDEYLIVVNKPSGLLVHKSSIDKKETRFLVQILRDQIGQYVYPVHRLDKPTSGAIIFALNKDIASNLSLAFKENRIDKEYLAVVRGYIGEMGIIEHPLKQMLDTKKQKARGVTRESQDAVTRYARMNTIELPYSISRYPVARYSLVKLRPKTGRKHQLRRHMKHIFHPIVGDTKHGRGEHNRLFRDKMDSHRLLLHALNIEFMHPRLCRTITVSAPLDSTMKRVLREFEWSSSI